MVPQADLDKASADQKTVAIATIIAATGLTLPLPRAVDVETPTAIDAGVLQDYRVGRCKSS
jgi:hypothetical protein